MPKTVAHLEGFGLSGTGARGGTCTRWLASALHGMLVGLASWRYFRPKWPLDTPPLVLYPASIRLA